MQPKFTLDGTEITVGMEVYLLQVPVMREHEFKIGKVVKISDKTVHVSYNRSDRWSREDEIAIVKRQPHQLITVEERNRANV